MIQQRITQYIEKNHLFSSDSKILVALSGGADSVALLRILHTAGYHCEAAHCNFHLRGEESNRDESFVRQLCLKYNIRLHTADFNTTQYAAEKHISIEMAARELRYNWFEEIKNKYRCHCRCSSPGRQYRNNVAQSNPWHRNHRITRNPSSQRSYCTSTPLCQPQRDHSIFTKH